MTTLSVLLETTATGSTDQKLAAAMDIANFMVLYNEEWNLLLRMEAATRIALYKVTHNEQGVDEIRRLELEYLQTHLYARKAMLDLKMSALYSGEIGISAPGADVVKKVKQLSAAVAADMQRDRAITAILQSLARIAKLVDGAMTAA